MHAHILFMSGDGHGIGECEALGYLDSLQVVPQMVLDAAMVRDVDGVMAMGVVCIMATTSVMDSGQSMTLMTMSSSNGVSAAL